MNPFILANIAWHNFRNFTRHSRRNNKWCRTYTASKQLHPIFLFVSKNRCRFELYFGLCCSFCRLWCRRGFFANTFPGQTWVIIFPWATELRLHSVAILFSPPFFFHALRTASISFDMFTLKAIHWDILLLDIQKNMADGCE